MVSKKWVRDTLTISYSNPVITPFRDNLTSSMDEVMYFYYNINILDGKKSLFKSSTHDFPKVQNLAPYIDYILDLQEDDMFIYEDHKSGGFHRKKLYSFITLDDSFGMNMEYFYKIERNIMYVKQCNEENYNRYEDFTITIGQHSQNKSGYSNGEDFGECIFISELTRDDLIRLKNTALEFCEAAIKEYNRELKKYKIKCPKCQKQQLFLNALQVRENEEDDSFKCIFCKEAFSKDDDYFID